MTPSHSDPSGTAEVLSAMWGYTAASGHYDEMSAPDGSLRAHWAPLARALATIGPEGLERRWAEGQRLIQDNGITYNVYGDPHGSERPWPLDPLPMLLAQDDWTRLEKAMVQRATLLNQILADLYGPQKLVRKGLLPPELVFAHPGFLRPCHGLAVPGNLWLHIYAADLARGPDGNWWIVADRTQAPSGAGYALENRIVSTRILPDVFNDCHVRRLALFHQAVRESLQALAPGHRDNPRVVLLTPGPYNETYFEHAYLARYLGYSLVEGGDLTVRDQQVYLKTLGGLLPVDVILRRQDDSFCDPLELRSDSMLGVPGLLQAVRAGRVAVANALGSGLAESPGLLPFLPALARHILGEELHVPSAPTVWCGDAAGLRYTCENLDRLVVKKALLAGREPVFGNTLSQRERKELLARIRSAPRRYVAQECVALSTAPVWQDRRLEPRHLMLRVFAAASSDSYQVMPGALARVSSSQATLVVSMQHGGGSKDTWVLADGPVPQFSLLPRRAHPVEVSRATFDLPSRVADNLFWMGRYAERIESGIRLARNVLPRLVQEQPSGVSGLAAGFDVLMGQCYIRPGLDLVSQNGRAALLEDELMAMIFDSERRGSVAWNVARLHRVAWLLRDRISADTWRVINRLEQKFSQPMPERPLRVNNAIELMDRSVIRLAAFSGLVMESMTRGPGWRLLDIGRRLERGLQVIELLRFGMAEEKPDERARLQALLEIADSALTYRSRYLTSMQADLVIDLLLLDDANPRSAAFQLERLSEHIEELRRGIPSARRRSEPRRILRALTDVRLARIEDLVSPDGNGRRRNLEVFLESLAAEFRALSDALTRCYLSHTVPSRSMYVLRQDSA